MYLDSFLKIIGTVGFMPFLAKENMTLPRGVCLSWLPPSSPGFRPRPQLLRPRESEVQGRGLQSESFLQQAFITFLKPT